MYMCHLRFFLEVKILTKHCKLYNIFVSSLAPAECKTWPTKDGGCCVFPFLYHGKFRNSCVFDAHGKLWCSITNNYDIDEMSGICEGEIP